MERFGNLLFALFTSRCPLFLEVKSIIKALYLYSDNALKAMCSKTRGSIMWILTLQTRHFFRGNEGRLIAFTNMKNKLHAQDLLEIQPSLLILSPKSYV